MFQCWMRSIVHKSSVSLVQQVIFASLQCTFQRLCFKKNCREPSALNLWNPGGGGLGYNIWKQSMRSSHPQLQQTTNSVWVDLYKHLFVYGKPSPKLPGQGNLWLELTMNIDFVLCKPWPIFSLINSLVVLYLNIVNLPFLSPGLIQLCKGF